MPSNIQNFIAALSRKGFAKQNRFDVVITPPQRLGLISPEFTFRAESASFPGKSITTIDDHRGTLGPIRKIGYNEMYENYNITFICDRDLTEKEILEQWMDLIVGNFRVDNQNITSSNYNVGYYDDYKGTIEIQQYDETGRPTYKMKLLEAYPTNVSSLEASWASSDIHKVTGTFAYRYYQVDSYLNRNRNRPPELSVPDPT